MIETKQTKYLNNQMAAFLFASLAVVFFLPAAANAQTSQDSPCDNVNTGVSSVWQALATPVGTRTEGPGNRNAADASDELLGIICQPYPRIKLPGLSFSSPQAVANTAVRGADGSVYVYIPFLGEYLAALYRWAVGAAGIIAVLMIIVSGLQWMMPGNIITSVLTKTGGERQEEQTNQAKKRMAGAIIGLILAVGSYVILWTINPELVQFKNLRVKFIEQELLEYPTHDGTPPAAGEGNTSGYTYETWQNAQVGAIAVDVSGRQTDPHTCVVPDPSGRSVTQSTVPGVTNNFQYFGNLDPCNGRRDSTQRSRRELNTITTVVLHLGGVGDREDEDECENTVSILFNRGYSTHYVIGKNGTVCQTVDESLTANHAAGQIGGVTVNPVSIGIDLEADQADENVRSCFERKKQENIPRETAFGECTIEYSENQYTSLSNLITNIRARVGRDIRVVAHCEITENGSGHHDPPGFDWSRIGLNWVEVMNQHPGSERCPFKDYYDFLLNQVYPSSE